MDCRDPSTSSSGQLSELGFLQSTVDQRHTPTRCDKLGTALPVDVRDVTVWDCLSAGYGAENVCPQTSGEFLFVYVVKNVPRAICHDSSRKPTQSE